MRRRPPPEQGDPLSEDVEGRWDLWRAVAGLPARQQEAVVLHYVLDLPVGDVAQLMRCREGTVKAHLFRARVGLREILEGARDDR